MGTRRSDARQREVFWSRVDASGDCWLWTGASGTGGYGNCWFADWYRRPHRVAYELLVGPIPEGLQLDHLCRVRLCVNPDHLEAVTPRPRREGPLRTPPLSHRQVHADARGRVGDLEVWAGLTACSVPGVTPDPSESAGCAGVQAGSS